VETGATGDLVRHRQTKGAATDMVDLKPPASHSDSTIFDLQLDFLGRIRSDQFGSDAQRKIDPGGDTAAGYYIAVTGYPIEVRCCAEGRQELSGKPMAGSTFATQQSCRTECQRSGAHRRDEACCRSEPTQFRQEGFVEDGIIDASPAGNADDVARIDLGKAMQSADDDPPSARISPPIVLARSTCAPGMREKTMCGPTKSRASPPGNSANTITGPRPPIAASPHD